MEDGSSWILVCIVMLLAVMLQTLISTFVSAIKDLTDIDLEELQETNAKTLQKIQFFQDNEQIFDISAFWMSFICQGTTVLCGLLLLQKYVIQTEGVLGILYLAIGFLVLAVFVAVICYGIPKRVGSKKCKKIVTRYLLVYECLFIINKPIIYFLDVCSNWLGQLFGVDPKENLDDVTEDEIITMVNEGHEQGMLLASEAAMIHNIFEFGDKDAKDIMIHRRQIEGIDGDLTFQEALAFIQASSFSRFPVYLQDMDNIIGILHIKDAMQFSQNKEIYSCKLRDLDDVLTAVDFIPETHSINTLFAKMQSKKSHMVIVVDEYGQTCGLISMENILEEIVGNIEDEHDEDEESISEISPDYFHMQGATELEEAESVLGIKLSDEYDTLNGFLIDLLHRIPEEHETFEVDFDKYCFRVLDVSKKMIQEVLVFPR